MMHTRQVLGIVGVLLLGGCANTYFGDSTALEDSFGDSARALAEAQRANPEPSTGPEESDGARLERVVEDYRGNVGERQKVRSQVQLGVPGSGN